MFDSEDFGSLNTNYFLSNGRGIFVLFLAMILGLLALMFVFFLICSTHPHRQILAVETKSEEKTYGQNPKAVASSSYPKTYFRENLNNQ